MRLAKLGLCLVGCFLFFAVARAEVYSSADFSSADPVVSLHGGYSASVNFQLFGSSGPIIIGESTSTNFIFRTGFLYFPFVTAPIPATQAGDSQVTLSWSAADAALGYTISGYDIGMGTASGGPYSFSNVGNVLSSVRSSLTNGTPYYFVVRAKDVFGSVIATSSQATATPVGGNQNNNPGNNGGGGGAAVNYGGIYMQGSTFPGALVFVLKNGVIVGSIQSDAQGEFIYQNQFSPGNAVFSLYATDQNGSRTGSVSYTAELLSNATVSIIGIILPPLVTTDRQSVIPGDRITIIGRGAPNSSGLITFEEIPALFLRADFDKNGNFSLPFDTSELKKGEYTIIGRLEHQKTVSGPSELIKFLVGDKTVDRAKQATCKVADFNCDGRVDLVDFSILLYWFDKPNSPTSIDLNTDGTIDIGDFSILIYYWTG